MLVSFSIIPYYQGGILVTILTILKADTTTLERPNEKREENISRCVARTGCPVSGNKLSSLEAYS